ncbi:hypothetical protein PFICI_14957 [Pestalotiopsis fici W106-1]|uniref:Uncharacterized protein n=1 Tax=Pestalotiopsis fici (strain W106-1 / CGMCC3.15140) TaxID=1229662 RepID=W3WJP1_PESFW|nr:uncharacterized protein PFICI_14957 [Pestalotiopsis fici W106-1]ETS73352.1 hypothetical protein PFICI_14957 [Pestalotiopsis fici W106-1]
MTWMLFVFCVIRLVTCSTRIAWAANPTSSKLAVAAQVFNSAGIIIIYIVNMIFAQRILRSKQPKLGWNGLFRIVFKILCALIVGSLIMAIVALVVSINTTNLHTLRSIHDVILASSTYSLVLAVFPSCMLGVAYLLPSSPDEETFGTGSQGKKSAILLISCSLAIIIAGFKTGTTWEPTRSALNPAWFDSKAAFYCFDFMLEVIILAIFLVSRVDNLFHVPNGCKGPGDYTRLRQQEPSDVEKV